MWPSSPTFSAILRAPVHVMTVKAQVLDTDFNVVTGGEFYDTGNDLYLQNFIADGSVEVDSSRAARRTVSLSILNDKAEFSPNSAWGGLFYVNRLIRVWRGVRLGAYEEYVPIGTFMIDRADVVNDRNMSVVSIQGRDLWKKFDKAKFGTPTKYTAGTSLNTVIAAMGTLAGVTSYNLDDLSTRTSNSKNIQVDHNYEAADDIGQALLTLCNDFGIYIFFDPLGRLTTQDTRSSAEWPTVWNFDPTLNSTLLTITASYTDDKLYNHVMVTGTADQNNPVHGEFKDTDPTSPTNTTRIGLRTYQYESSFIKTQEQADATAKLFFLQHLTASEDISLDAICNPALEATDYVAIKETDFTKVDSRYRIDSFSIPLSSSRQSIKLSRAVLV